MPTINDNFDIVRGDLIYGLGFARTRYMNNGAMRKLMELGFWIQADNFNNETILNFPQFYTKDVKATGNNVTQLGLITEPLDKKIDNNNNSDDPVEFQNQEVANVNNERAKSYVTHLYNLYPPSTVKTLTQKKLSKTGDDYKYKMIRRCCKFGIKYIASINKNGIIHFVLDGIDDMLTIVNKTFRDGQVPITTSELRYVFRNWKILQNRVIFYLNQDETTVPWIAGNSRLEWERYAKTRLQDYIGEIKTGVFSHNAADIKAATKILYEPNLGFQAYLDETERIIVKHNLK
jgi:hypothetical protein